MTSALRAARDDGAGSGFAKRPGVHRIVWADPAMREVFDIVEQVAPSKATVLITGESGTGKELFAHAVHDRSPRADRPFGTSRRRWRRAGSARTSTTA